MHIESIYLKQGVGKEKSSNQTFKIDRFWMKMILGKNILKSTVFVVLTRHIHEVNMRKTDKRENFHRNLMLFMALEWMCSYVCVCVCLV